MLLCFAFFGVARADVVEIGDGGTTNNSYLPGYNFYNYSLTQQIYTADEIGMAGTINSIAFKNTGAEKTRTYNVYMLLTDKETFSNGTDWVAMSDDDLVFSGSLTFTVGEWTEITLETPFAYDGTSNLLVGVADVTSSYSSSPHMACLVFSATSQAIRAYRDGSAYDITAPGVSGSVLNVKNQIQLDITPGGGVVCTKPTLAVSGVTHNEATLTVGGGSGTYNVQYKAASATTWTNVATNTTNTTFPLSGLNPLTAYEAQVQSVCEGGALSDWRTASFSTTAVAVAVGDAWSDDFEGTSCAWELVNGEISNAWVWGSAATNGGSHALYISNDGGTTNAYTVTNPAMVYATKLLNFTQGKFEFSFDCIANGEGGYDFLRVALVPASVTLTAGTTLPSGLSTTAVPTGWIAVDGGSKLNVVTEWQNKTVAVNVPAGNYYLVMAWRDDTSAGNQPPAAVDNVSITRIACEYDVTGLAADNITSNSAILTWTAGEATQWQVAYADNVSFEHETEAIVSDSTYTMTGLQPASTYYAKVRAYCGGSDFGAWSTVINLFTDCVALTTYPYTENFDSYTAATGFLPICWDRINTGTSYNNYPYVNSSNAHSTYNCLYFNSYGSSSSTNISDQYAILPQMENLAGKQINLFAKGSNNQSTFKIGTMTDPTDVTTFTEIATQELTTTYQEFIYDVPATATDGYIAIMMEKPNTSSGVTRGVYIDDITIDFPPSCPKPMSLAVTDNSVTAHNATITWTETGEATQWIVEFDTVATFAQPLFETVDDNPTYTFQGLAPETTYYVRVKAHCGPGDESVYSNVVNFTTTIPCPAPTGFAVADLSGYTATLNWTGTSESYIVSYRTAAYTDGLDETFAGTSIPTGWENKLGLLSDVMGGTALSTGAQWNFGTSNGVFDQHARINIYGSSSNNNERHGWLITPAFTVVENASLNFDLALTAYSGTLVAPATNGVDDKFVVLITTDDEATWTILRQWDNEEGSTYVYNNINSTATGEHVSIDLSRYAGQSVRIAFYGESTVTNADNNLHIDNVGCGIYHEASPWQTVTVDEAPAILTSLIPETAYQAKLQGNCGDLDGLSEETSLISFTTLNTCPVPTELTVVDSLLTATTAGLNWHGSVDVDSYTVRFRVPEHLEGGINETFEESSIPMGWSMYNGLLSNVMDGVALTPVTFAWSFGSNNGVFDSHARVNIYSNNQRWLVTPTFTLASSTFTFDLALTAYSGSNVPAPATNGTDDKFVVLISTNRGATWTILRQWDNEEGSTYVYNNIANTAEGEQVSIDLSSYVGQKVCIAFYGESTVSNADNNLHIDNVVIGNPVVIPDSEWLTAEATATNIVLTDLTPETTYEAQVKSNCSDPEEWSDLVVFTTPVFAQTIALAAGQNWFSTYVDITLNDLKAALVAAAPGTAITIQSQTNNTTYNPSNNRWAGRLTSLDLSQMYILIVENDCELTLEGMPINPADHPVTIANGSNWIAYPLNQEMTLTDAFAGFAVNGDGVQSQTQNSSYIRNRWQGQLSGLTPGKGYLYNSSTSESRTFTFPTSTSKAAQKKVMSLKAIGETSKTAERISGMTKSL